MKAGVNFGSVFDIPCSTFDIGNRTSSLSPAIKFLSCALHSRGRGDFGSRTSEVGDNSRFGQKRREFLPFNSLPLLANRLARKRLPTLFAHKRWLA
jgi:hypothetical protein